MPASVSSYFRLSSFFPLSFDLFVFFFLSASQHEPLSSPKHYDRLTILFVPPQPGLEQDLIHLITALLRFSTVFSPLQCTSILQSSPR